MSDQEANNRVNKQGVTRGRKRRVVDRAGVSDNGPAPLFILVEPQMGENIGAAARAMLNFGVAGLRLVSPRDGWPNPSAKAMAAGASIVIDGARVFDSVSSAVADCTYVLATTARPREARLPVYSPDEGVAELSKQIRLQKGAGDNSPNSGATSGANNCAILFGSERAGLSANHLRHADGIITVPVNPNFASLNLAQAVLLMAYEWGKNSGLAGFDSPLATEPPAPRIEFDRLMEHLEQELELAGFFHPPEKKPLMVRNLNASLVRAGFTHIEIQTLRGVIKALARGRGQQGRKD